MDPINGIINLTTNTTRTISEPIFNSDSIQISIAVILLITAFFSFLSYCNSRLSKLQDADNNKTRLLNGFISEERRISNEITSFSVRGLSVAQQREKILRNDELVFKFYEHFAILLHYEKIDNEISLNYFKTKFPDLYGRFMNSSMFTNETDRAKECPYLSALLKDLGYSIEKYETTP